MKSFATFLLFIFTVMMHAQDTPISAWQEKWENSKNYLIKIAEAMPEENYGFKPTKREMTFADQLLHIANNINWLSHDYFGGEKIEKFEYISSKKEIINILNLAFANAKKAVANTSESDLKTKVTFFAGPKTKLQILNLLQDHVTHHRGQLIVYLNLNEVKPPQYSGW
ncbi:DinB family protein [Zhouia sp. PK063]|uniref:DinB family protein n=1 Tax=Zhouia sp. PK063 TaxID=3373602 RepID=UPI0037B1237F